MKKLLVVSALAVAAVSGAAHAANGEVQFLGVVTNVTCDIKPVTGGGTVSDLVQLGTVLPSTVGADVPFALMPDMTQPGCQGLTGTNTATISWSGPFDAQGLQKQSGAATGAWTEVKSVNAKTTPVQSINTGTGTLSTDIDGLTFTTDGAKFTAALHGGATPGDYQSSAAFVVAYN